MQTLWSYEDAIGNQHLGYMEKYLNFGGTDHVAAMRDAETGELSMVSGSRLRAMRRRETSDAE